MPYKTLVLICNSCMIRSNGASYSVVLKSNNVSCTVKIKSPHIGALTFITNCENIIEIEKLIVCGICRSNYVCPYYPICFVYCIFFEWPLSFMTFQVSKDTVKAKALHSCFTAFVLEVNKWVENTRMQVQE